MSARICVARFGAAHGVRGRGKEVTATGPTVDTVALGTDQAQIRLVDQRRGAQGLGTGFVAQTRGSQDAQLVVNERQGLRRRR